MTRTRGTKPLLEPGLVPAKQGAEELHIRTAFLNPQDTKPYMSAKVPGQTPVAAHGARRSRRGVVQDPAGQNCTR
ncbi:hypothetical protein ABZT48_45180 [Streptomyces avermitilis]|uniref:hypothetical protein n=1 Tax=Streptomyces avermitilis TaxID=33903 RepID=UPI0033A9DB65